MDVSKTSDHIQIEIKILNPSQEPPVSSKTPNLDLNYMNVLCTFKIRTEIQNSAHGCIKDQWQYPSQDQDAKLQPGTCSILNRPKSALEVHGDSLYFQIQFWQSVVGSLLYHWPVTISESKSTYSFLQSLHEGLNIDVFCTFKIKTERQNLEKGCIKD